MRVLAIAIELLVLSAILYSLLAGVRLAAIDLDIGRSYSRALTMALLLAGIITIVFFVVHLAAFYPG